MRSEIATLIAPLDFLARTWVWEVIGQLEVVVNSNTNGIPLETYQRMENVFMLTKGLVMGRIVINTRELSLSAQNRLLSLLNEYVKMPPLKGATELH